MLSNAFHIFRSLTTSALYSNLEWLDDNAPTARDYYETFEQAKAVFTSAVRRGDVVRVQKIVTHEVVSRGDMYCGQTTDRECCDLCFFLRIMNSVSGEILANTKEWHAVTVGREPGVFSSE